ncbi:MAG: amidohydrolase [Deltaproteobacteria bacterium]|nr:amidohydrolase [Deltaproteobacteria bacterium]MBW2726308.1 amidohydrolase [Deltaproteobacteria bacterium]
MLCTDWFIDADTHITEPGDVWTSRLPRKYQDAAPRMIRNDDGVDLWQFGQKGRLIPVGATAMAGWPEPFPSFPKNLDEAAPATYDAKARLEYMDEIGAWAMALYPNIGGFGSETFLGLDDPELMLLCVQAYNDWLIEWMSPDPRRFIPVMATPFWDVDAAVTEIHRCRDIGHRAILFTAAPQDFGMPFIGDPHWNPIWNAAQEVDLPVSLHIGSGDFQDQLLNPGRFAAHGIAPTTVQGSMSILMANAIQLIDVVMSGILPRNPRLRLVSVESGIGWLPFVKEALNHGFDYTNVPNEKPEFTKRPGDYIREQVWACTFFEEFATHTALEEIGVDRVLFETDYPHPICLYGAEVRDKIDAAFGDLSKDVRDKVLFENAAELYGVEAPDRPWEGGAAIS